VSHFYAAQLAYALTLVSYGARNMVALRLAAIAASCAVIYYAAVASAEPLWLPLLWNIAFAFVNLGHLAYNRWQTRNLRLDPLEDFLAKTVLANFPAPEVRRFAAIATQGTLPAGSAMIHAGTEIHQLFCILQGRVDVVVNGVKVAELGPGRFVGEMSLLTRSRTRADVVVAADLQALAWKHEDIDSWVSGDANRLALLQTAMGTQVVEELLRRRTEDVA
jgi:hypothetical protein